MDTQIVEQDILYRDYNVCILKPEVKKGVLIFTNYTENEALKVGPMYGIKSPLQLYNEGNETGRKIHDPYITFRAPYYATEIDYTSVESEIRSSFGENEQYKQGRMYIRVDPNTTKVFSSQIRDSYISTYPIYDYNNSYNSLFTELYKSRKTMSDYLSIIRENENKKRDENKQYLYHLYTYKITGFPTIYKMNYPFTKYNVNRRTEVQVTKSHMTPDYFVAIY